ncbi:MAG TPA: hypothetical protein DCQ26_13150 [Marinilabiliales bacterium]|nr:MAG: hypothetical protein A2W84_10395 [Bacteroidetes bacterium GWC2_40_13]OFX75051.1 MAG: hypothetical protein A2W96_16180 [Bacteroidetes bacterium GWD2_40_43]OFX89614.1 MAG: hypothetical protein A2W97_12825 [Bacteroidetes bacterium GWE2_40_63]OFY24133.1 MAG: hypothetical protein A2W88_14260 [Bacteroidetes bacterium GWF2_40_13]OFZ26325.1 MAG: hypothetical protein A2437_03175 [Bacteroidetes bacterium RIFOXYC2_FULL_40_12]HAM99549.1 hypothetical protein [Marinilabiliales bacterium]
MKTKLVIAGLFLFTTLSIWAQKGVINNGAKIIITSSAILDINGGTNGDYINQSYDVSSPGKIDLQGKIKLEGDWQNQATTGNVFINSGTDGEIIFDGSTLQTIGGTASTYFEKVTLSNPQGVSLSAHTTFKGNLTLNSGLLKMGAYNLLLDTSVNIAGTPSTTAMILANSTGSVYKYFKNAGTFTFPVGDTLATDEYSPFSLTFNSGTFGAGAYVKLNVFNQKHPDNTSSTAYLNRYWTTVPYNISGYSVNMAGYYANGDVVGTEGNIYTAQYTSPYWDRLDITNTSLNKLAGTNLTSLSEFTGAESSAVMPAITLSYDGSITEGNENSEVITITLSNDDFVASLNTVNWTITNLPDGVSKGTLARTGNKTATLTLSGNRTKDFDSNISNVTISVASAEFVHLSSGSLSANSGVTITATSDAESITIADDGLITEGSEDGEIITATAVGGTFATTITPANWTLTNLPTGVSKGSVTRVNGNTVQITLSGNRTVDYSVDITNATLSITNSEIDEYTGSDLSVATGVTFTAVDESLDIVMAGTFTEGSESSGNITVTINSSGSHSFNSTITQANWTLTNLPVGVTKGTVTYNSPTQVTISLLGTSTKDYDNNITNVALQIAPTSIIGFSSTAIITSGLTFTATDDAESITIADNVITEGAENTEIITVILTGGTFANTLTVENWAVTNLPMGVSVGSLNRLSATSVELTLSGNSCCDFDADISNVTVSISPNEIDDHTGAAISANSGVTIVAVNDTEVLTMAGDGTITEGSEDGEIITVSLTGGTIIDPITSANWVLSGLPTGVTAGTISRLSSSSVSITLVGNATQDYDSDWTTATLSVSTDEINDTTGTTMEVTSGITFTATDEPVMLTLTDDGITEGSENGEIITVSLSEDTFVGSLNPANWTITNLPAGVTKGNLTRVSDDTVQIALTGSRTQDYDSDITNVTISIAGAELVQHTLNPISQNSGLIFDAVNDGEFLLMADDGQILEGNESGEIITATIYGGTFVDVPNLSNWSFTGLPVGVTIGSLNKINETNVQITLSGDATLDYDTDITDAILSISETEIDDYSDVNLTANSGVTFTAVAESIDILMSDDGNIFESHEDAEIITVSIHNDVFTASLNSNNWALTNLPEGVILGSLNRVNDTVAEITLSGYRTKDYDSDIVNLSLSITPNEFLAQTTTVQVNSGVLFIATNDTESIVLSDNADITEGNENGKVITVNLIGGTFSNSVQLSNWTVTNLPAGVSVANLFKTDTNTVELTLSGNRTTDYDVSITDFSVSIKDVEVDEFTGADLTANTGVTFQAFSEGLIISHTGLNESNLNGAEIGLELVNESFLDAAFDYNNFTLQNAPGGVSIGYISYMDAAHANLYLYYDGTDFDADITDFYINISLNELVGVADISSNQMTISATLEATEVTMSDHGIYEGSEHGAQIFVVVTQNQFGTALNENNWSLSNLPQGTSIDSIIRVSADSAIIVLAGNRTKDYDESITNIILDIAANEFINSTPPVTVSSGVIIYADNDNEVITISDDGIDEGLEDGEKIYVNLQGGTFALALNASNWAIIGLPEGVLFGNITKTDSVNATITLTGNSVIDYDADITNIQVVVKDAEVDEYSGSDLYSNAGIVFRALNDDEVLTMNDDGNISEGAEDGETIDVYLAGGTFVLELEITKWSVLNLPSGVSVLSVNRVDNQHVTITLSGISTVDYDQDITGMSLSINGDQINDYTGFDLMVDTGVTFKAKTEAVDIFNAGLNEENLNGAFVSLLLQQESFADTVLLKSNFVLSGLPIGVALDSVYYISSTEASLLLSFDGTDFDTDQQLYLEIVRSELTGNASLLSDTLLISSTNDDELVSMVDDGQILEGSENGEEITVTLTGGTFANTLQSNNWSINNAPLGVAVAGIQRNSNTSVTLTLSGNSLQDYDANIYDFTLNVSEEEINDYQGPAIIVTSGVTFTTKDEQLTINHSGLNESNLNGAIVTLVLVNETFTDATILNSSIEMFNTPDGLSIASVAYISETSAELMFSFDETDFDTDISDFFISVDELELSGAGSVVSNSLIITANEETQTAEISHLGLTEENLDGAIVTLKLKDEKFEDITLNTSNFNLLGAPIGLSIGTIEYLSDTVASIALNFTGTDFDTNYEQLKISVSAAELVGNSSITSNSLTITATNDAEALTMVSDGFIQEGTEDGELITFDITGGTFSNDLSLVNWSFYNLPAGVAPNLLTRVDNHKVTVSLIGNTLVDYDQDITNLVVQVNQTEIDDYEETPYQITSGVTFTAIVEPEVKVLTISHAGLTENNLNGALIEAKLTADYLTDLDVNIQNLVLMNTPLGVSVVSVLVTDSVTFTIGLAFDGTDFDSDYTDFKVTLQPSELHGAEALVSNGLEIRANIESQQMVISSLGLTEENLHNSIVYLALVNDLFRDTSLEVSNFKLMNAPNNTFISSVTYVNDTAAELTLSFDSTDFDTDISDFAIIVLGIETYSGNSILSNSLTISATNDEEVLTMSDDGEILEHHINGEIIMVAISGGDFVSDLNISNWNFVNGLQGLQIQNIQRISKHQAALTLGELNLEDFDANISDLTLSVAADEINDHSGLPAEVSTGIVFIATVENIIASHIGLTEANLNGSVIDLLLENEKFADTTLDISNITIQIGSEGASISQILYLTDSTAQVAVSFDGRDFDSDQTLKIGIAGNEFIFGDSLESNSLQVLAFNDEEIFTLADDGQILEGQENAETIELTLSGGTFATLLNPGVWVFENLPQGVTVGAIQKVDAQHVNFVLEGSTMVDYDSDITQFAVQIPETEFEDYSGTAIVVTGGVTFTAVLENSSLFIEYAGLNESNLDQAIINMKLVDAKFDINQQGNVSGITLNNVPDGLSVSSYQIENDTLALATLDYTGSDFDTDFASFNISLDAIMLQPAMNLTSNTLLIQASIEPAISVTYDGQIVEGSENGEVILVTLSEGKLMSSFTTDSIATSEIPVGVGISNLQILSDTQFSFELSGNRTEDYDQNYETVSCYFSRGIFQQYFGQDVEVVAALVFDALNETMTISHSGLTEGNLNGAVLDLELTEEYFIDELLSPANITLFNAPQGVTIDQFTYKDITHANISLLYDGSGFTEDVTDFYIELNHQELFGLADLQSNSLIIDEGVGILGEENFWNLKIFAKFATVFVTIDNIPQEWESATITIFDSKGVRVLNSDLKQIEVNKVDLNVLSGYYLVLVKVNDKEFINKLFILPE